MSAAIQLTPLGQGNVFPFGPRIRNSVTVLSIQITNSGNFPLVFSTPAASLAGANVNDFAFVSVLHGQTVQPGTSVYLAIQFTPTAAVETVESATVQLFSNATSGPTSFTLTGISSQTSDVFFEIVGTFADGTTTAPIVNFGNVIAGQTYTSQKFFVGNPTTSSITHAGTPLSGSGYSIVNDTGVSPLPAGQTYSFQIQLIPHADMPTQDDLNAVSITVVSGTYTPQLIEAQYNTIAFTPFAPLTDSGEEMWIGCMDATGDVTLLFVDDTSLVCEEDASFAFTWDFKSPDIEKSLARFLLRYEALGAADTTITFTGDLQNQAPVSTERTLSALTGGGLLNALYDAQVAGATIRVEMVVTGGTGPLSVALYIGYYEPRGEIVENT